MGRFSRKYSDEQIQALTDAVLNHGMPVRQAAEALHAGTLNCPPTLEPVPIQSVRTYVKRERQRRQTTALRAIDSKAPEQAAQLFEKASRSLIASEMQRLQRDALNGPINVKRLRELQAAMRDWERQALPHATAHKNGAHNATQDTTADLLTELQSEPAPAS